jgi:hypothetical protein
MGSPYQSQSATGYNSSPPPDDGTTVAANKITWSTTIKAKLADPIKTLADAINTALRSALNVTPSTTSIAYTTLVGDHLTTIEATGTITISLGDAATMIAQTMGYKVTVYNKGVGTVTVTPITGTDTLNGVAGGSLALPAKASATFTVAQSGVGYDIISAAGVSSSPLGVASGGTGVATLAANRIPYGNGTSAFQSNGSFTFDGTIFGAPVIGGIGAGAVGSPSFYLSTDTTTGRYRIGANNIGEAISGVKLVDMSAALFAVTGSLTATGLSFVGASFNAASQFQVSGSIAGDFVVAIQNTNAAPNGIFLKYSTDSNDATHYVLQFRGNATDRLFIDSRGNITNTNNSYGAISDAKFKADQEPMTDQWDDVLFLSENLQKFTNTNNPSGGKQAGLTAQDIEQRCPGLVDTVDDFDYVESDEENEKGEPLLKRVPLGTVSKRVKYSIVNIKMLGALGRAMRRIEALEAQLAEKP